MKIFQLSILTLLLLFTIPTRITYAEDSLSSDERAVNVAQTTYAQLVAQKEQLNSYIRSQQEFASAIKASILKNRKALAEDDFERAVLLKTENFPGSKNLTATAVVDSLGKDLDALIASYQTDQSAILAEQAKLDTAFKQIAKLDQQYQALEQSLLRLSQPKMFRDDAKNFSDFLVSAVKAYQAQQKADKDKAAATKK